MRMTPPLDSPLVALQPQTRPLNTSEAAGGALDGAARGASDVLRELSPDENPAAFALIFPLAVAAGAMVGALSASLKDPISARPIDDSPVEATTIGADALDARFAEAIATQNVFPVEHTLSDEQLVQQDFDSVIDVILYTPVVTGNSKRSRFVLLHKMQVRSLTGAFEPRTWYRERVSKHRPVEDWLADDGREVRVQLFLLQVQVLRDLQDLLPGGLD